MVKMRDPTLCASFSWSYLILLPAYWKFFTCCNRKILHIVNTSKVLEEETYCMQYQRNRLQVKQKKPTCLSSTCAISMSCSFEIKALSLFQNLSVNFKSGSRAYCRLPREFGSFAINIKGTGQTEGKETPVQQSILSFAKETWWLLLASTLQGHIVHFLVQRETNPHKI